MTYRLGTPARAVPTLTPILASSVDNRIVWALPTPGAGAGIVVERLDLIEDGWGDGDLVSARLTLDPDTSRERVRWSAPFPTPDVSLNGSGDHFPASFAFAPPLYCPAGSTVRLTVQNGDPAPWPAATLKGWAQTTSHRPVPA